MCDCVGYVGNSDTAVREDGMEYSKPKLTKYGELRQITFSRDVASEVGGQIAAMALKESYDKGNRIEIPSLGISIKKDD